MPPRTVDEAVDENGYFVVRASGPGTVTALEGEPGSFVHESTELAEVQRDGSVYVESVFILTTQQYARIGGAPRATVVLPDGQRITGEVAEFTVEEQDGETHVVATVHAEELVAAEAESRLVSAGAPVETELHLENDGVVSDLTALLKGYLGTATDYVAGIFRGATS